eukprot:m.5568 g.5568  ORF g.5568 m.5568 type:complete len:50 (-) comp5052_c0_seq2:398-547(-)
MPVLLLCFLLAITAERVLLVYVHVHRCTFVCTCTHKAGSVAQGGLLCHQ